MGRRKKNHNLRNIGIISLAVIGGIYAKINFFNGEPQIPIPVNKVQNESRISEQLSDKLSIPNIEITKKAKLCVRVFFIQQKGDKEVYRIVKRENTSQESNIKFAVKTLLNGPTKYEQKHGVYSEIPQKTKLLSITETPKMVKINVSDDFENSNGADSLYKRMYQLIKTVNSNSNKPVYLEINGQEAETLGGDGLMIKQPLNRSSLDG